jgi:glycosyltransferase involved in cell wall biosynthesis
MPRFSLVLATLGRTSEVECFLASLQAQSSGDVQLIVVDQNEDDRLVPILSRWSAQLNATKVCGEGGIDLLHIRSEPGLSRARNVGLSHCTGEIVAFPDDDCMYPPDTLSNVSDWFRNHPGYDILSLTSRDQSGVLSGNKWHAGSCDLAPINIFRTSQSYTYFVKRTAQAQSLLFDEGLGVGSRTRFGSGEDTDFLLTAMDRGMKGRFLSAWHVVHPCKDVRHGGITEERFYSYGLGMGRVQGKHSLLWLWLAFLGYDFGRAFLMLCLGKKMRASLWFAHGKGLMQAYYAG